jgi:hypothetical protein
MGVNELVLKVPGSEVNSTRPPVHQPPPTSPTSVAGSERNSNSKSSNSGGSSSSGNDKSQTTTTTNLKPIRRKSIQKNNNNSKTHSRESSGASNLSVKFSVSDETASVSTAASNPRLGSRNSNDREVDEDLTLSDRLSHEDLDMDDDGFHQGSKSCESIPQDRLTPDDSDDDRDRR